MTGYFAGRASESAYIKHIWHGSFVEDYTPICPADTHWNLLFMKHEGQVCVIAEGAPTKSFVKQEHEGSEFLVVQFEHGVYMPHLSPKQLIPCSATLPNASGDSFWLKGQTWQIPDSGNVEIFVDRLVNDDLLVLDPVVNTVLCGRQLDLSERTVRRRFLTTTGMTPNTMQQIERVRRAASLLEQGMPIIDVVVQTGYADQPHLTRSLRRYFGQTPLQLTQFQQPEYCPLIYAIGVNQRSRSLENA